jgi:hypothetical protein
LEVRSKEKMRGARSKDFANKDIWNKEQRYRDGKMKRAGKIRAIVLNPCSLIQ